MSYSFLRAFICARFESIDSDHHVLKHFTYSIGSGGEPNSASYEEIIEEIAASGSPVVLLVLSSTEVDNLMREATNHPSVGGDSIVWVGVDLWIKRDLEMTKNGMIGLSPYTPSNALTTKFMDLWKTLDPLEYIDSDGDRTALAPYSLQIVDSVFAIAFAFQQTISEETALEGDILKRHVYTVLTSDVEFEGVSGNVLFNSVGDRPDPIYNIVQFNNIHEEAVANWLDVGYLVEDGGSSQVGYSKILWPDGSTGVASSYNEQYVPYCPAGQEPIAVSETPLVFECHFCRVGFYNDAINTDPCASCPEGTDCEDIGIVIPCIKEDYWRHEPPDGELGDFDRYQVYVCDILNSCKGGCVLNATCAGGREPLSPTCGVCLENYYLSAEGKCIECDSSDHQSDNHVIGMVCVAFVLTFVCQLVYFYVARQGFVRKHIKNKPSPVGPPLAKAEIFAGRSRSSYECEEDTIELRQISHSLSDEVEDCGRPENSVSKDDGDLKKDNTIRTFSVEYLKVQFSQLLSDEKKLLSYKKSFRNATMTFKIVLSFVQVMSQSFFVFRLDWPQTVSSFKDVFAGLNPFHANVALYSCSDIAKGLPPYYFTLTIVLIVPLIFVLFLFITCEGMLHYHVVSMKKRENKVFIDDKGMNERESMWNNLRKAAMRLLLWFFLVCYPSISSHVISLFNCRDFGEAGIFIRRDTALSCESLTYQTYLPFAILGTLLYVVGIPLVFFVAVRNRRHEFWMTPGEFLHFNYTDSFKYYECYDLIRKLALISIVQFVAEPNCSSQALYLFGVDLLALLVLVYAR
jgi:hypothetical protein